MQTARTPFARVARGALFAAGAVALSECSSGPSPQPLYGAACPDNDCGVFIPDASSDASDASDAGDAGQDAPVESSLTD